MPDEADETYRLAWWLNSLLIQFRLSLMRATMSPDVESILGGKSLEKHLKLIGAHFF